MGMAPPTTRSWVKGGRSGGPLTIEPVRLPKSSKHDRGVSDDSTALTPLDARDFERLLSISQAHLGGVTGPEEAAAQLEEGVATKCVRACSLYDVTANFGSVLTDNAVVPEKTHRERSKPVRSLDAFLSHSWKQPRWQKFLQIAFHFHLRPALVCAFLGAWLGFFVHLSGLIPILQCAKGPQGRASSVIGALTFLFVFFLWGETRRFRLRRFALPLVFLDKYCVNQEDYEEKKNGIKALGATIARSKRLVILHSPSYFTRLWTVYEVACFMSVHSLRRLSMVPEFLPKLLLIGNITVFIFTIIARTISYPPLRALLGSNGIVVFNGFMALTVLVRAGAAVVLFRRWAIERKRMQVSLSTFRIQDAKCFAESDRVLVQGRIAVLEKALGLVSKDATEEEACDSFNSRVQQQLPNSVFVGTGLKYRYVVAILLPILFGAQDKLVGHLLEGTGVRKGVLLFMQDHVLVLILYPLVMAFCIAGSRRCLHWHSNLTSELLYTAALTLSTSFLLFAFRTMFCTLNTMASSSDTALVVYVTLCVAAGTFTWRAYTPRQGSVC